jgi:hypothetical protein
MEKIGIRYCFILPDGSEEVFNLQLDAQDLDLVGNSPDALPAWTILHFHQCPNCPLTADTHPNCPIAVNLVNIVKRFDRLLSHKEIHLDVVMEERSVSQDTTAQQGISSLMGLVMATSGCPHTAFFKPMARFHLPLASEEETTYRATSMYLLAQYFLKKEGQNADLELKGLREIYHNMHTINTAIAERLRGASETDSTLNAIVLLDMFALTVPHVIEESLEDIRHLFAPSLMGSLTGTLPASPVL